MVYLHHLSQTARNSNPPLHVGWTITLLIGKGMMTTPFQFEGRWPPPSPYTYTTYMPCVPFMFMIYLHLSFQNEGNANHPLHGVGGPSSSSVEQASWSPHLTLRRRVATQFTLRYIHSVYFVYPLYIRSMHALIYFSFSTKARLSQADIQR